MQNARFKVCVNGSDVKVTLRPGQSLAWGRTWAHEEGWSSSAHVWSLDGGIVRHAHYTDGRDCDGRFSTQNRWACLVDNLGGSMENGFYPEWVPIRSSQRDYSAEAMGY